MATPLRRGTSGGTPPSMQMPLAEAMALLGVPESSHPRLGSTTPRLGVRA